MASFGTIIYYDKIVIFFSVFSSSGLNGNRGRAVWLPVICEGFKGGSYEGVALGFPFLWRKSTGLLRKEVAPVPQFNS